MFTLGVCIEGGFAHLENEFTAGKRGARIVVSGKEQKGWMEEATKYIERRKLHKALVETRKLILVGQIP